MLTADGKMNPKTKYPFIMKPSGHAHVFGPGRADGPFPEHYEPLECPIERNLMSGQFINPTIKEFGTAADTRATCDPRLLETQPQLFCEMSHELAKLKGVKNGGKVIVESARGKVEAVAIVTIRFKPFMIAGTTIHQVGLPWCFGWVTPKDGGDSANLLTPSIGDPNTKIPETKAFMVNVRKA